MALMLWWTGAIMGQIWCWHTLHRSLHRPAWPQTGQSFHAESCLLQHESHPVDFMLWLISVYYGPYVILQSLILPFKASLWWLCLPILITEVRVIAATPVHLRKHRNSFVLDESHQIIYDALTTMYIQSWHTQQLRIHSNVTVYTVVSITLPCCTSGYDCQYNKYDTIYPCLIKLV